MNAIRKIIRRKGNIITIELPEDFRAETIELIVLPADEVANRTAVEAEQDDSETTELQRLLLKAPPMTEEELQEIHEKRKALSQWQKRSA